MDLWLIIVAAAVATALVAGLGLLLWRRADSQAQTLLKRTARLPLGRKLELAMAMARDERIPLGVRAIPPLLVLYLAMPLDVVPDFIPVLGQLDDIAIVLVAGGLLLRFTPRRLFEEHLAVVERNLTPNPLS